MGIDVVKIHNRHENQHKRHEDPSKTDKERVLAYSPKYSNNDFVAIIETSCETDITGIVAYINVDRVAN